MKTVFTSTILAAGAVVAFAAAAPAATVTVVANNAAALALVDASASIALPAGAVFDISAAPSVRSGTDTDFRSPFEGGADDGADYFAVSPDNPENPSHLEFSKDQFKLEFLWGSVDTYNELTFWNDGAMIDFVTGADFIGQVDTPGLGAAFVSITTSAFDKVSFFSSKDAFEFASIEATPVPVPAGLPLLASALGLGWLVRRRSAA